MSPLTTAPARSAIVLVDAQERLCNVMPDIDTVTANMQRLLTVGHWLQSDLLITEQYPAGLGATLPKLKDCVHDDTAVIEKTAFSCWGAPAFVAAIQAVQPETIVLAGLETHVCIQQTALEAQARGYSVVVIDDAVCSRHPRDHEIAVALMRSTGITVSTTEALAFDWLKDAAHPSFKVISKLFRNR